MLRTYNSIHLFFVTVVLMLCTYSAMARSYMPADIPNVQLQDSTRLVSNPDGILSADAENAINARLLDIRRRTTSEVAMVVIDSMDPSYNGDIDTYATDLYDLWRLGKKDKDNGTLVVVAKDDHRYVFRTGYGAEGVLPDVVAARLGRRVLEPAFRAGNFDGGLTEVASQLNAIFTDPNVREELRSEETGAGKYGRDDDDSGWSLLYLYLGICLVITVICLVYVLFSWAGIRNKDNYEKYLAMRSCLKMSKLMAWIALGLPLLIYFPLKAVMHRWRDGQHPCPNCGHNMEKMDEEHDNEYLTPAQDTEERINSVDYDVWLCPHCGERDIYRFINPDSNFTECPNCHARACRLQCDRVITQPTTSHEGYGVKVYNCLNCNKNKQIPYRIAKLAAPPVVIIPDGGGRGGGFSGGGFGGGGFGGGMTGGGGASGGW